MRLHGGPNTGTCQKPLLDNPGHAKLAYGADKMTFQPTVAGSWDVDTVFGPQDVLVPAVIRLGDTVTVELSVAVKDLSGKRLREKHYPGIALSAGLEVVKPAPLALADLPPGLVAVEYTLR